MFNSAKLELFVGYDLANKGRFLLGWIPVAFGVRAPFPDDNLCLPHSPVVVLQKSGKGPCRARACTCELSSTPLQTQTGTRPKNLPLQSLSSTTTFDVSLRSGSHHLSIFCVQDPQAETTSLRPKTAHHPRQVKLPLDMPKTRASPEGAAAEPPRPKRRRLPDDDASSMPRYSSPAAEDMNRDEDTDEGRPRAHRPLARRDRLSTGSNRARDASESRSRSITRRSRTRSTSPRSDEDEQPRRYRSGSSSRSRSRSSSRSSRSYSRSPSRSRSPPSRSRSRSRSRTSSTRDRSRSVSPSRFQDRRSSKSHTENLRPNYRPRLQLSGHAAAISQVRISPDGKWIASASADGSVKIWDAKTGENLDTLIGHMAGVSCLAWAPDSNALATGSDDKAIRLWDRVTASPAHACGDESNRGQGPREYIRGSGQLARAARGGRTGLGPLLGHHNYVYCLAFSPKGNILASGSYDEAVFLWDVRAGRLMRSLPAHSDPVSGIGFCCDGTLVVSCSTDGLMYVSHST